MPRTKSKTTMNYLDITIDDMTPEQWRTMTPEEHQEWWVSWTKKGVCSFCCLKCGFPTAYGQYGCDACKK